MATTTSVIEIDGLLIESSKGGVIGVPGWATAPTLREALFTVAMPKAGHYNLSHQPTMRAICSYTQLEDALEVCRQLCELLGEDEVWLDPYRLTMPGEMNDWRRANAETWSAMKSIIWRPASYEKWPVRELE